MRNFDQGQTVRIKSTFRDFDNALVNPTVVTFYVQRSADDVWDDYSTTDVGSVVGHPSTGIYYVDISTTAQSGVWRWRVTGTGSSANADQGTFYVNPLDPGTSAPA